MKTCLIVFAGLLVPASYFSLYYLFFVIPGAPLNDIQYLREDPGRKLPEVISTYRDCDIVRAYDQQREEFFYFAHCGKERLTQVPLY